MGRTSGSRGRASSTISSNAVAIARPISVVGWRTVVSGGVAAVAVLLMALSVVLVMILDRLVGLDRFLEMK